MPTTEYIQIAGKSNIYIGFPADSYAALVKVGEQTSDTQLAVQHIKHKVPGDRHGGPEGPPIEEQILGMVITGELNLSRWDQEVRRKIERFNAMATDGAIAQSEIGSLLLRDRSFRILIDPTKTNAIALSEAGAGAAEDDDYFVRNFVCCTIDTPIACGQGTKFSSLRFSFTAHRAPEGHPLAPEDPNDGLIWNRDRTGIPA